MVGSIGEFAGRNGRRVGEVWVINDDYQGGRRSVLLNERKAIIYWSWERRRKKEGKAARIKRLKVRKVCDL